MKRQRLSDQDVLAAIEELAGDGFCLAPRLLDSLPRGTHADRRRAINWTIKKGMVIERRGPDGRMHLALASEGWRLLRAA
jgi:hypothetical protein